MVAMASDQMLLGSQLMSPFVASAKGFLTVILHERFYQ